MELRKFIVENKVILGFVILVTISLLFLGLHNLFEVSVPYQPGDTAEGKIWVL